MQELDTGDFKDVSLKKHFTECNSDHYRIYKMVAISVGKGGKISEKSLGRPYPQICTGVNGENLQLVRYQFSASIF